MLGIILWVKCLEESCQHRAAISMQISACGAKCNWPNNHTDGAPPAHSRGCGSRTWRKRSICLFSFSPSEHKQLLCCKRGARSTLLLRGKGCMGMRVGFPPSQQGCENKGSVFQKEKGKCQGTVKHKNGWLTRSSLQRIITSSTELG